MRKVNSPPFIHHFSHPHPLELSSHQEQTINRVSCSGCKLKAAGTTIYACKICNYFLHISCSQMPQHITHPVDPNHTLTLLPFPVYPEGFFRCDACGRQGNGFSYHCQACNIDIHTFCSLKPLSLNHQSHQHQLNLTFAPPYYNKSFSCDICHEVGSNHWLYRCNLCEFDAHLACATAKPKVPVQTQMIHYQTALTTTPQYQALGSRQTYVPSNHMNNPNQGAYRANGPIGRSGQGNGFLNQAIQSLFNSSNQQLGQSLVQGIMGGGGGDGGGGGGGDFGNATDGFGDFSSGSDDILGGMDGGGFGDW